MVKYVVESGKKWVIASLVLLPHLMVGFLLFLLLFCRVCVYELMDLESWQHNWNVNFLVFVTRLRNF